MNSGMIVVLFKRFVNIFNLASCLFLVFTLAIRNYELQETAYFLFFGSYVAEIFTDKKWNKLQLTKTTIYFLLILIYFLLVFFYRPFEQSDHYFKFLIEKRYPLLGFSIVGFLGVNNLYKLKYFVNTIIITSISIIIYLVFFKVGISAFIGNTNLFNLSRNELVNSHMVFNFYLNSSIVGIWYLLSNNWKTTHWLYKHFLILCIPIFILTLSISEGRTGFGVGLLVSVIIAFVELWKRKKTMGILFLFIIPWAVALLVSSHQRMTKESILNEPRFFLWQSGLHVVKESPLMGHGMSKAQVKYDSAREIYQTEDYKNQWKESKHLDSHNQYLQSWMEFGIIGLALVLYIYFAPYFLVSRKRKNLALFLLLLYSFQSFFDMFITGQFSAFFCLWMLFLLRTGTKTGNLTEDMNTLNTTA